MKIAFVCPDDLSTVIFAKSFLKRIRTYGNVEGYTISPVKMNYIDQLQGLVARHFEVAMERYVSPVADMESFFRLWRIFRRERFDIVINFTTKPNLLGALAARLAGANKVVCAVRGLGGAFLPQKTIKGFFLQYLVKILYRLAALISDRVWFTNQGDWEYFLNHRLVSPEKIVRTTNALDINEYSFDSISDDDLRRLRGEFGYGETEPVVVMVARMIFSKGVMEFIEAADYVSRRRPEIRFLLVAPLEEGHPDAIPASFLEERSLPGNFQWVKFRKDIKNVYAMSDLAVLPSYYNEGGYPRALLEPMAFGKPVITTDLPQCRGPVEEGKNGYLVPPRDARALGEAILRVFENGEKRRAMGRYSRQLIEERFDDRRVVDKILLELGVG